MSKKKSLGVPAKKRSGSARVPSPKKATASRRSDPSREMRPCTVVYYLFVEQTGAHLFTICNYGRSTGDHAYIAFRIGTLIAFPHTKPQLSMQFDRPIMGADASWVHDEGLPFDAACNIADRIEVALGIGAKPKAARPRAGAKRSGAKPGRVRAATP